jgi:hypothetical protein
MKKLILLLVVTAFCANSALAWNGFGHRTVVEIAKRHLTDKAKENIEKYIPYDLANDASYMDGIRSKKSPYRFTNSWHSYYYDAKLRHEPNDSRKVKNGDTMRALDLAERNLSMYKELSDSAVIFNIRMILHFVGDMHCPSHCKFINGRDDAKPRVYLKGEYMGSFHAFYDKMANHIYGKKKSASELAKELDTYSKGKIKRICKGNHHDWAEECMRTTYVIHQWNPNDGTKYLRDNTIELSKPIIDKQLRHAGYRMAHLLNKYFGK